MCGMRGGKERNRVKVGEKRRTFGKVESGGVFEKRTVWSGKKWGMRHGRGRGGTFGVIEMDAGGVGDEMQSETI